MQTMDWNTSNESFCNIRCVQTEKEMNCILENYIQNYFGFKSNVYLSLNYFWFFDFEFDFEFIWYQKNKIDIDRKSVV